MGAVHRESPLLRVVVLEPGVSRHMANSNFANASPASSTNVHGRLRNATCESAIIQHTPNNSESHYVSKVDGTNPRLMPTTVDVCVARRVTHTEVQGT